MISVCFQATAADRASDRAGILTLDAFESTLLRDAAARGDTCVAAEKSGQVEFDFECGDGFAQHIDAVTRQSPRCSSPTTRKATPE